MPGGGNWVVQKYGGTSVGKFPVKIAEEIVLQGLARNRIAIVCSARSTDTKSEGTTTRLLRAARDVLDKGSKKYADIVDAIEQDHVEAGRRDIPTKDDGDGGEILKKYEEDVHEVCEGLLMILQSAQVLKDLTPQTKDMVCRSQTLNSSISVRRIVRELRIRDSDGATRSFLVDYFDDEDTC